METWFDHSQLSQEGAYISKLLNHNGKKGNPLTYWNLCQMAIPKKNQRKNPLIFSFVPFHLSFSCLPPVFPWSCRLPCRSNHSPSPGKKVRRAEVDQSGRSWAAKKTFCIEDG